MRESINILPGFITLSLLVHGLLLLIQTQPDMANYQKAMGSPILSISLSTKNDEEAEKSSASLQQTNNQLKQATLLETDNRKWQKVDQSPKIIERIGNRETRLVQHQAEPSSTTTRVATANTAKEFPSHSNTEVNNTETNSQPSTTTMDANREAQKNYLLGEIHTRLSKYMAYPYRARIRGWEGSVLVGFNIDKRGFLQNVHLSRTSGHSLLDNAALTAIRKVSNIPLNKWGGSFQPVALQLPVIYRLTSG